MITTWMGQVGRWLNKPHMGGSMGLVLVALMVWAQASCYRSSESSPTTLPLNYSLQVVGVRQIWNAAPHNAFTDLAYAKGVFYCVFREGTDHSSTDGVVRLLASTDGKDWKDRGLFSLPDTDLRDPKICFDANRGCLIVSSAGRKLGSDLLYHYQTYAWQSLDGQSWSAPGSIGEADYWLWRLLYLGGNSYAIGYHAPTIAKTRLYQNGDSLVSEFQTGLKISEGSLLPYGSGLLCVLRRDPPDDPGALVGVSDSSLKNWTWANSGVRIGGPNLMTLPYGRVLLGGRLYAPTSKTALAWLSVPDGRLDEILTLPSGGDNGAPGFALKGNSLFVSYYSSHEGKSSIYLAELVLR